MARRKLNGYSLFVGREMARRKEASIEFEWDEIFQEMDPHWRVLSDAEQDAFKEEAKRANNDNQPQQAPMTGSREARRKRVKPYALFVEDDY